MRRGCSGMADERAAGCELSARPDRMAQREERQRAGEQDAREAVGDDDGVTCDPR